MNHRYDRRYIYKLTFPNGMVYIGCTYDIKTRWAGSGAHYKGMGKVYDAIQEFGWDNIYREVIAKLPDMDESTAAIKSLEKEFIKAYSGRCYNSMCNPEWHESKQNHLKDMHKPKEFWNIFGETKAAKEWCEEYKTSFSTVKGRIKKFGLTYEQAITFIGTPKNPPKKQKGALKWKI